MVEFLQTTVDKFIFKVATDRWYSNGGLWLKEDDNRVRIGVTDFMQQRSGDVAFVEVKPRGTMLSKGDELALIETIKVNNSLESPVTGKVIEVNPAMETTPEAINMDPYGEGWLVLIEAPDWENDRSRMLDPQAYFKVMKGQIEEEARKP